jgi:ABC-2 type transport system permease protein
MSAIFKREFKSYFTSPVGYLFIAIMMFFEGQTFSILFSISSTDISLIFADMYMFIFFLIPFLTMKTMSEDRRQKVDQALITSPVSLYGIVFGKFFATFAIFMISYSITIVFQVILAFQPDAIINWLIYAGNVLGIALMGGALIALGIFVSSLTENQMVAAVCSFAVTYLIYSLDYFAARVNVGWFTKIVTAISFVGRYNAFTEGVIDYSNIVFFVGFAAIFIFLTVRVLDKRRYS